MATATASSRSSGGISFVGLLTIVFIVLKLTGFITWSWWWVLSPLWISARLGRYDVFSEVIFFMIWRSGAQKRG